MAEINFTDEQVKDIIERYEKFESVEKISLDYNFHQCTLYRILKRNNIYVRTRIESMRGEISEHAIQEIVALYLKGESISYIMKNKGLSRNYLEKILTNNFINIKKRKQVSRKLNIELKHDYFDILNFKNAYWAGFIATDGNISRKDKSGKEKHIISIALNNIDHKHLEIFKNEVNSSTNISVSPNSTIKGNYVSRFQLYSENIKQKLISYGITPYKSYNLKILNEYLLNSKDFWRGCVDGDGSIGTLKTGKYPFFSFVSASFEFIRQLQNFLNLLLKNEYNVKIYTVKKRQNSWAKVEQYVINLSGKAAYFITKELYQHAKVFLDRKMAKAQEILTKFKDKYESTT